MQATIALIVAVVATIANVAFWIWMLRSFGRTKQTYARIEEADLKRRRELQNAKRTYPAREGAKPARLHKGVFRNPKDMQ